MAQVFKKKKKNIHKSLLELECIYILCLMNLSRFFKISGKPIQIKNLSHDVTHIMWFELKN